MFQARCCCWVCCPARPCRPFTPLGPLLSAVQWSGKFNPIKYYFQANVTLLDNHCQTSLTLVRTMIKEAEPNTQAGYRPVYGLLCQLSLYAGYDLLPLLSLCTCCVWAYAWPTLHCPYVQTGVNALYDLPILSPPYDPPPCEQAVYDLCMTYSLYCLCVSTDLSLLYDLPTLLSLCRGCVLGCVWPTLSRIPVQRLDTGFCLYCPCVRLHMSMNINYFLNYPFKQAG